MASLEDRIYELEEQIADLESKFDDLQCLIDNHIRGLFALADESVSELPQ
jgi:flagellar motor switch protein FliG